MGCIKPFVFWEILRTTFESFLVFEKANPKKSNYAAVMEHIKYKEHLYLNGKVFNVMFWSIKLKLLVHSFGAINIVVIYYVPCKL